VIARIRDEGLNRSQVMETLTYLCDVIGPRLTGSPNLRRANEWTRDRLSSWGLAQAHLEEWGPFGRGWSLQRFSAQVIEPQAIPLTAWPRAWSHGLDAPIEAPVIFLDARTEQDLAAFKGKLRGAVVLMSTPREVKAHFTADGTRLDETNLLRLANASAGGTAYAGRRNTPPPTNAVATNTTRTISTGRPPQATNETRSLTNTATPTNSRTPRQISSGERLPFAVSEGAAVLVSTSGQGDGGTIFLEAVTPISGGGTNRAEISRRSAWATNGPVGPPQLVLAAEDYNRLVHLLQQGEKVKMAVDLRVQFHETNLMAWNTVAEIPGTDLKDELVMLGAHLDSWHSGTGATDNGAGVAVCMEAVRILRTLKLEPRRTVRVALWTGEEQGLLGSRAYVGRHFGYSTNTTNSASTRAPRDDSRTGRGFNAARSGRKIVRLPGHESISAYFNVDNGSGRFRGVYLQGNESVRPIFRRWLEPFRDLGAETLSAANTAARIISRSTGWAFPDFSSSRIRWSIGPARITPTPTCWIGCRRRISSRRR
jgi:hypothetical protein